MSVLRRAPMLALAAASLLVPSASRADTFLAPPQVMAAADGSFSYEVVFKKGPGTAHLGGVHWLGTSNCDDSFIGDGFCISPVEPGSTIRFTVSSKLKNPSLDGSVHEDVSLCDAPGGSATTTIRKFDPLGVGNPTASGDWRLRNEPNPFRARTTFFFDLPEGGPASLGIYDVAGRLVARVFDGVMPAGSHEVTWDRSALGDARGASGVLFVRLSFGGRIQMRRMVLLQ